MRDIRFRAWDSELSFMVDPEMYFIEMSDGAAWFNNNAGSNDDHLYDQSSKLKLMQYTGLKDKNGVDIYEGDLIESDNNCLFDAGRKIDSVKFDNGQFKNGSGSPLYLIVKSFRAEVIGNIHANPELLEQS